MGLIKKIGGKIKDSLRAQVVNIALTMASLEKQVLAQKNEESGSGIGIQKRFIRNSLLNALKEGKVTKETEKFRMQVYKNVEESYHISNAKSMRQVNALAELMAREEDLTHEEIMELTNLYFDNSPNDSPSQETMFVKQAMERVTTDEYFPLEFIINNSIEDLGIEEARKWFEEGIDVKRDYPLIVGRENEDSTRIEQFTDSLHVKTYDDETKLLEFFIPTNKLLFTEEDEIYPDLININSVQFNDLYTVPYKYENLEFYKFLRIKNYTVLKFKGKGGRQERVSLLTEDE